MIWYFFRKKTQIFIEPASHNWTNEGIHWMRVFIDEWEIDTNVDNSWIESSTITAPEFLPGLKHSNRQNSDNGFYLLLYWINRSSPWNTRSSLMVGRTIVVIRRFNLFNGGKKSGMNPKIRWLRGLEFLSVEQDIQPTYKTQAHILCTLRLMKRSVQ